MPRRSKAEGGPDTTQLEFHPLTPERWDDLAALFGERGAYGGCWCMWWRQTGKEHNENVGEKNREALRRIVEEGRAPGLLAYHEGRAVGWCSIAPRDEFPRVGRSPSWKPIDDQPAWSVVCYYVHRDYRGRGIAARLLDAAVDYAARQGARIVEAYPRDVEGRVASVSAYKGTTAMYRAAGFEEVARRHPARPIMRKGLR